MPSIGRDNPTEAYWRSLDDLAGAPEVRALIEEEFPGGAWDRLDGASRRQFLKAIGASLALAGVAGCRWPREEIVPYAYRPPGRTPGVAERYATAVEIGGVATGLLVTSYDGRPIKIEGNPKHPFSLGGTSAIHQASVLELYDPDRSRTIVRREGGQTLKQGWDEFEAFAKGHFAELRQRRGKGLAILSEATSSPSVSEIRRRLTEAMPESAWYEYEPISWDNEREGTTWPFGRPCRPHYAFDKAAVIVCLDADPLMTHPAALRYARDFAKGRRGDGGRMNRLYVVESAFSVTGGMADHRLAVPSWEVGHVAMALADQVGEGVSDLPKWPQFGKERSRHRLSDGAIRFVRAAAQDLLANRGKCVIAVGRRQPPEVHLLGAVLNEVTGGHGKTVRYTAAPDAERPSHAQAIKSLSENLQAGRVETLVILGGNPVFDAPADVEFESSLKRAKTSVHLGLYDDETSEGSTWHVPRAHYLESWGDARAYDGTVSVIQPLIDPLYGGKTPIELLALILGGPPMSAHEIARRTFGRIVKPKDFEPAWRRALHDGFVAGTGWPTPRRPEATPAPPPDRKDLLRPRRDASMEVVFREDHSVYDGRFANNAWLQEWPDPMTKLTWDNAAVVGPRTAETLGVGKGDRIRVTAEGRRLDLPVYVMPGQADGAIAVSLGYGRRRSGRVGDGVGVSAYSIRTSGAPGFAVVEVSRPEGGSLRKRYAFASTQDQHPITTIGEKGKRERLGRLIVEADLSTYRSHPDVVEHVGHHPPLLSLWSEHEYGPHRWAMAIDLTTCIGCGACVVACQAENNVPVVGKVQVARGREMHWLRVDRYFKGAPDAPTVVHQPVACMHCENAPCEQVCPVAATVHDREGLNVMVYNRCVGTRYCSNNCPYKVRRFNFFNWRAKTSDTEKMVMNPEVTVRSRGVMEKCTFCVQRIQAVKIAAKNDRRLIRDGEIVPACAQACPTGAIVFGDLADETSAVSRLHRSGRAYHVLAALNVKPRTAYLARLRNPSPALNAEGDTHGDDGRSHGES